MAVPGVQEAGSTGRAPLLRSLSHLALSAALMVSVCFAYEFETSPRAATLQPSTLQSTPLSVHGHTVYVAEDRVRLLRSLKWTAFALLPSAVLIVVLAQVAAPTGAGPDAMARARRRQGKVASARETASR